MLGATSQRRRGSGRPSESRTHEGTRHDHRRAVQDQERRDAADDHPRRAGGGHRRGPATTPSCSTPTTSTSTCSPTRHQRDERPAVVRAHARRRGLRRRAVVLPAEDAVQEIYGFEHIVPTHQGRGAEHLISKILIKDGQYVPGNMYFTTTRVHQELAGGTFVDVIIDEAHDARRPAPVQGQHRPGQARGASSSRSARPNIAYVNIAATVNMAGGQPVSMANLRDVSDLCRRNNILLWCDATRRGGERLLHPAARGGVRRHPGAARSCAR